MSIWIRSQDGTLAECSRIDAPYEIKSDRDYSVKGKWIIAGASDCVAVTLGYYANEQRALEVMDDIFNHINGVVNDTVELQPGIMKRWEKAQSGRNVFQMPAE